MSKFLKASLTVVAMTIVASAAAAEEGQYYTGVDAHVDDFSSSPIAKNPRLDKFSTGGINRAATPRATERDNRETGDDGY